MIRRLLVLLRSGSCGCGHGRSAHRHYRAGPDCSLCQCRQFRR